MASYPPPTGNDPNYNANDFTSPEAAAAAGNYVERSGDTMTGALTVPTLIATTIQTQTLDSTTVIEGDYYRILQPGSTVANSNPAQSAILLNPKSVAGSGNDLIQTGDSAILFTAGSSNTGALTIAPMTNVGTSSGMRMDGVGNVECKNDLQVDGFLYAAGPGGLQVDGPAVFNNPVIAQGGSIGSSFGGGLPQIPAFPNTSEPAIMVTSNSDGTTPYNPLVSAGDSSILFQGPTGQDSGTLVIGPSTGHMKGVAIRGSDGVMIEAQKHVISQPNTEPNNDNAELTIGGYNTITINPSTQANAQNPQLQDGDCAILFGHDGLENSVDLHIGPYTSTNTKAGVRVTKNGEFFAYGPMSGSSQLTLEGSTNQLILGTGAANTSISAPTPAASRIATIPDVGANASFVMTQGSQTINGSKVFGASNLLSLNQSTNQLTAGTATANTGAKYTFSCSNSANERAFFGPLTNSTKSARGLVTIATDVVTASTAPGVNVDPGDDVRCALIQNKGVETVGVAAANRAIGMCFELWPSSLSLNNARVYNDLSVKRETIGGSSGSWNFGGFNNTFTGYATYHRLCQGTTIPSFLCTQGTDNTIANQPGLSLFTQDSPSSSVPTTKFMIGNNLQTAVTGGFQYGNKWDTTMMGGLYQNNNRLQLSRGILVGSTTAAALFTVTLTLNISSTSATASAMLLKIIAIGSHQAASTTVDTDTRTQQLDSTVQLQWINGVLGANVVTNTTTYFDSLVTRNISVAVVNPTASTGTSAVITVNFSISGGTSSNQMRGSVSYDIMMDTTNMITSYGWS